MMGLPKRLFQSDCQNCLPEYCLPPKSRTSCNLLLGVFIRAWVNNENSFISRHTSVGKPTKTYIPQIYVNTVCSLEDFPRAMNNKDVWWSRDGELRAISTNLWEGKTDFFFLFSWQSYVYKISKVAQYCIWLRATFTI